MGIRNWPVDIVNPAAQVGWLLLLNQVLDKLQHGSYGI